MRKGIVLEVDEDFVTLLTPEGEFIQVKKEGAYQIGEEIGKLPMQRQRMKKTFFRFSSFKIALTSMVAVCLLIFAMFSSSTSNKVYAYLSIDINPSIEIAVNKDLKVVKIKGYNQDGKMIVTRLSDWQGEPFIDIAKKIIELSIKNGYLQEGEEVLITTVKKETSRSSSQQLVQQLNEVKQSYEAKDIIVTTQTSTLEVRKEAVEKGFTTGKYLRLTEKAKEKSGSNQEPLPSGDEVQKEAPAVPIGDETEQTKDTVSSHDTKEQKEQWNPSQQAPPHIEEKEEQLPKVPASSSHHPDKFQEKYEEKEQKSQEKQKKKFEQKQEKKEKKLERRQEKEKKKRREDDDKEHEYKDEDEDDDDGKKHGHKDEEED
ncbi:anti-sigma factor-like protein [Anoxybacillus vitaminiphilus]|uniref:Anti-sigma factor-like protein n=1 Tax=Paranoxybacillus vitaminiphilus TaxID=581036 RepID=A0A327YQ33_9BACL|nr:anti-sigma factor domain-containing protein [Anoxybacillus vitaminiphilus]RAK23083.1 anti-sigma factor-like protein [Anoxybacillus vitaminiphilus]